VGCGFPAEARPFAPHVTIGRADGSRGARGVAEALVASAPSVEAEFLVRSLVLFRSETLPQGARYAALRRVSLGPSAPAG
jgi:2'-5' RNA ligase